MTRWDLLKELMMSPTERKAIGKAWPLFFYMAFIANKSNKCITSYAELKETLNENTATIKQWRDHLTNQKIIEVIRGRSSMTLILLSPYDSIVTCEQDDITQVKMKSDPATKRVLDQFSSYNSMSLLPIVAELVSKIDNLEKKLF